MARSEIFETTVEHFLAPIMCYMNDDSVGEIMVNRFDEIYIEQKGKLAKTDATFSSEDALRSAVNNVLQYTGKRVSEEHPLIDSRLPDGSRVAVVLSPLCRGGTCMTIRKFAKVMFDAEHLIEVGTWTRMAVDYLSVCVEAEKNMLVAGGTSSGKTSLLNVLSMFINPNSRIVTIEDSAELDLNQEHLISLEARSPDRWGRGEVTIRDLFRSSLRLRPDRIVIGEVRGGEGLDMIQAMNSGHAGSMSTLHADTAIDALSRLETLAMMSQVELPLHALRAQIASAIEVIVLMARMGDGRRQVTEIAEIHGLDDTGHYNIATMFKYQMADQKDADSAALIYTGQKSQFGQEPKIRMRMEDWGEAAEIFEEE